MHRKMPDFGHWIFCLFRTDFIKKRPSTKGILIISKLSFYVKGLWTLRFLPSKWDYWENGSFISAEDFVKVE